MDNPRDIRVTGVRTWLEHYDFRTPLKFGGVVMYKTTILNAEIQVETRDGRRGAGLGSMILGNTWAWPSRVYGFQETMSLMEELGGRLASLIGASRDFGHPVELAAGLEESWLEAAAELGREKRLAEPIPKLAVLVAASPFDAALHDAYGKVHGLNVYNAYGPEFMNRDLAAYLTGEFAGEYLDRYTLRQPKEKMPLYHLIGALDPLAEADIKARLNDGYPETLPEWINRDGLTHLKIKLNGSDLDWDVNRVLAIDRTCREVQAARGVEQWYYSADFNERCPNVRYLLDFLARVKAGSAGAFERIQYIEQPTSRHLKEDRANKMHEAARVKPVVIDEALVDFEHLQLAMEMGYSGVALKTCKGHTQALLMAAAALKYGLFLCVQDLTLVGESYLHSIGLGARVPKIAAVEGNGRQYCPVANTEGLKKWPEAFTVKQGSIVTANLVRPGLGH